jgi:hypothetical protein
VYHRPFDPQRPVVCLDETTKQLVRETRTPLPAAAGRPVSYDYEYERQGVATLFMLCAPLHGWREVSVRERKTRVDYDQCLRALAEEHFPQAEKIVLVQDNLNTHAAASLYQAFEPGTARRLLERFEFHYTPQAWQLAQHRRDRVERPEPPMPRPSDRRVEPAAAGSHPVDRTPQSAAV